MKKSIKILLTVCLIIQTIFSTIGVHAIYSEIIAYQSDVKKVFLNNFLCDYKNKIINVEGVTYVPLRETFELMGADVNWYNSANGSVVKIYAKDMYDENISENGVKYCYYKEKINVEKSDISDMGYKYIDILDGKIVADTPEELITKLKEYCDKDPKNDLYTADDYVWYNVYQSNSMWIVYMQTRGGTIDVDVLYTVDKDTGDIEKHTAIGPTNLLNSYIVKNK